METLLTKRDWLHMYKTAINDQKLDMDQLIRRQRHPENYASDLEAGNSQIDIINSKFGQKNLNWDQYAEYSGFLEGLFKSIADEATKPESQANFN